MISKRDVPLLTADMIIKRMEDLLPDRLGEKCIGHHILTEDDLQFATYSEILSWFSKDVFSGDWRVFNRRYDSDQALYPDLSLFAQYERRILIELKHEVERNVTKEHIKTDIKKIDRFLDAYPKLKFGVVLATTWDPNREIEEYLEEYARKANNYGSRLRLILIDVSKLIDLNERHTWLEEHKRYFARLYND